MEEILFRQEKNGGFKFNRKTGTAQFFKTKQFKKEIKKEKNSFDIIPIPENPSKIALTAPLAVWHETTHSCNLNCKPCGQTKIKEPELNINQINNIYQDLSDSGVFEIRITGGEACIRKDIEEIIHKAKENKLYTSLTSNGVYDNKLREKIISLPIELYIISLDGTERVNDLLRGEGTYSSTITTIQELGKNKKKVRINTILMKQNKDQIGDLVEILKDKGASALTLIPLRPAGDAIEEFYENKLTPKEYMETIEKINKIREKHPTFSIATKYDILSTNIQSSNIPSYWSKMCIAGIEAACISPSGNLRACILQPGEQNNVGNLTKYKLNELWHNDGLWGIFRDTDRRVLDQCKECKDYTIKCPGSCLAMTEFSKSPEEIYCFKDLIKHH